MKYSVMLAAVGVLGAGTAVAQQPPIKIGVLYPLTGGGAVYGVPAMAGHQLAIEELNAKGGIMGRKIEIDRARRQAQPGDRLVDDEGADHQGQGRHRAGRAGLVGRARHVGSVSKQEKVVYISTIPKTIQMTTDKLHKYVFRTSANTDQEGDTMAMLAGKNKLAKICHLELDYAYGNDLEAGILKALPKYAPDAKIVLTLKPKLGATDFNPFIPQVMAAGCDGVLSGLWGPHFVSWVKQAAPLGFFDKIKWISGGEIGSHEIAGELKGDYPDNVISNTYELWYHGNDPSHKAFQARLAKKLNTQETPQWAVLGYIGVMYAAAAMEKAKSTDADKVAEALEGLSIGTPVGKLTIDAKTPPGQHRPVLGTDGQEARPRLPHDGAGGIHPAECDGG